MNFEDWFKTQDFYLNMRFKYGDNLFNKNGDIYQIATVNMIKLAFDYCGNTFEKVKVIDNKTLDWVNNASCKD